MQIERTFEMTQHVDKLNCAIMQSNIHFSFEIDAGKRCLLVNYEMHEVKHETLWLFLGPVLEASH